MINEKSRRGALFIFIVNFSFLYCFDTFRFHFRNPASTFTM